jgi:hypothetical protein
MISECFFGSFVKTNRSNGRFKLSFKIKKCNDRNQVICEY